MLPLLLALAWAGSLAQDDRYKVTVQGLVMLQEGLCVFVPCSFIYPGSNRFYGTPAFGYWFREETNELQGSPVATNNQDREVQEETQGRFQLLGDLGNHNCSLDIRDAQRRDTGRYFFRVDRGYYGKYSYKWNQLTVHVTGTLESGHPMNLTCSVPWACERGTPPPLLLDVSCSHFPGSQDPPVLHAHPHPMAPGPWDQPHLSGAVSCSRCDCGDNHPAQRHLSLPKPSIWCLPGRRTRVKRTHKKKAARPAGGKDDPYTDMAPAPMGRQMKPMLDSPADPTHSTEDSLTLGTELEVYYDSISFQK